MNKEEIMMKVREVIVEQGGMKPEEITNGEETLEEDLNMDDLDMVETLLAIEEEFDISVPDDDFQEWETVNDIVDTVKETIKR